MLKLFTILMTIGMKMMISSYEFNELYKFLIKYDIQRGRFDWVEIPNDYWMVDSILTDEPLLIYKHRNWKKDMYIQIGNYWFEY